MQFCHNSKLFVFFQFKLLKRKYEKNDETLTGDRLPIIRNAVRVESKRKAILLVWPGLCEPISVKQNFKLQQWSGIQFIAIFKATIDYSWDDEVLTSLNTWYHNKWPSVLMRRFKRQNKMSCKAEYSPWISCPLCNIKNYPKCNLILRSDNMGKQPKQLRKCSWTLIYL